MTTSASALMTTIVYSVKERNPFLHDVLPLGTMKGPALRQGRAVSRRSCSAFRLSATSRPSAHAEETSGLSAFAPNPLVASDSLAVLRGNLAPSGAVIKPPAAEPRLHRHAGRALVFEDYNHMAARIDDPDLDVDENSVLVLQNAGPLGAPGMPEWGQLPIPKKLLAKGVRDMLRVSDARMSGTSYGACVTACRPGILRRGPARPRRSKRGRSSSALPSR